MAASITTAIKGQGQVPQLVINDMKCNIGNLDFDTKDTAVGWIANQIIKLIGPLKDWVTSKIQEAQTNNKGLKDAISKVANDAIMKSYPTCIPISQFDIAISTYLTGALAIYPQSAIIPAEGFIFQLSKGYKPIES